MCTIGAPDGNPRAAPGTRSVACAGEWERGHQRQIPGRRAVLPLPLLQWRHQVRPGEAAQGDVVPRRRVAHLRTVADCSHTRLPLCQPVILAVFF